MKMMRMYPEIRVAHFTTRPHYQTHYPVFFSSPGPYLAGHGLMGTRWPLAVALLFGTACSSDRAAAPKPVPTPEEHVIALVDSLNFAMRDLWRSSKRGVVVPVTFDTVNVPLYYYLPRR